MPKHMTKKEKIQNCIIKNPEMGLSSIAQKLNTTPGYVGTIRRELRAAHPELELPELKRGRKAKAKPKAKKASQPRPITAQRQAEIEREGWAEEVQRDLERSFDVDARAWEDFPPPRKGIFIRMLNALGFQ